MVTSKIIEVEPVGLARLASDDTHARHIGTFKDVSRQKLKRASTKIFICTIKLSLLPGHEEVDRCKLAVRTYGKVDSGFFQTGRGLTARKRVASGAELRCISITAGKEDTAFAVVSKATTRHPDTSARDCVGLRTTFHGKSFDNSTGRAMEADHSSSEIPLDTMRSPACVDEVSNLEHTRASVLVAPDKHPIGIIAKL